MTLLFTDSNSMASTYSESKKNTNIGAISKPVRTLVKENKINQILGDPENTAGHNYLRNKYALPKPN